MTKTAKTSWDRVDTYEGAGVYRSSILATDARGRQIRTEVARLEPGRWSVELTTNDFVTTMNAYRSFRTQAEAKAWAVAFVAQRADQGLEIVKVVRILSLGEVVRCLEGSGYGEHQLEAAKEVMTKRRARVEALEAAAAEGAALADAEMVGKGLADPAVLAQPVVVGGAAIEPAPKTRTIWSVVQITAGQRQSWTYSTLQQAEGAFVTACEQHASLKVDLTRWTEGLPGEVLVKRFERDDVSKKELLEVLQRVMTQITTIGSMDMRTYEAATSLLNRHAGSTALVKGA